MSFFSELKRRSVFRVGAAYVVTAWLAIQVVETIFPAFGFGDGAVRVVTIVFVIGLIPALILAWVFEITPEGVRKAVDVSVTSAVAPMKGKRLDQLILLILALALAFFVFDYFVLDPRREAALEARQAAAVEQALEQGRTEAQTVPDRDKSVAVLAFRDMSPGKDHEYLSDGIAEELLNVLAGVPELRVISRSSAFSYKGKDVRVTQIAEELNVAHILEGSVRKSGDLVRITAQLIEAHSDTHLWSETYDRTLDDIFAVQDEIAVDVAAQLKVALLDSTLKVRKTSPEAYALYLEARQLGRRFNGEDLDRSTALLQRVVEIDPEYVPAWANLAANISNKASMGLVSNEEMRLQAGFFADRALEIDPEFAQAHSLKGWLSRSENDLVGAAGHYERALALNPSNIHVLSSSAILLVALGRLDEAIALQQVIVHRDPLDPSAKFNLGVNLRRAERLDEAINTLEALLRLSPERSVVQSELGLSLLQSGHADRALHHLEQERADVWRMLGIPMALHALGRMDEADAALQALENQYGEAAAYNIAYVHAFRGQTDTAFEWLERELEMHGPAMPTINVEPLFRNIHSDPRWTDFLRRIGKAPEQLRAIEFNVKLPEK